MVYDPEISALGNVYDALKALKPSQVKRILDWATGRLLEDRENTRDSTESQIISAIPVVQEKVAIVPVGIAGLPIKKRRGRKPKIGIDKEPPAESSYPKIEFTQIGTTGDVIRKTEGFMAYNTLAEVFKSLKSKLKTTASKVLVTASFLQDSKGLKEMSSYDVTGELKMSGQKISNASVAIEYMMKKKPPLLLQTGTLGTGKQPRRKFRVTVEGLANAREYLKKPRG